jgi:pyrophosphatase PpaX
VAAPLAVLFDLDGTLVDTVPFILACARHAFEGYPGYSDAGFMEGIGTPLRSQMVALARAPEDAEWLVARYRAYWIEHHDRLTHAFPGAVEAVAALAGRGHPLAVVTAKTLEGAHRTLRHTGLAPYFGEGTVVGADSCARCKPDPEPVRLALARLGADAGAAVLIGDSVHDLAAARAAGVRTVAATWGVSPAEVLERASPDHSLGDVRELPGLLDRLQRSAA